MYVCMCVTNLYIYIHDIVLLIVNVISELDNLLIVVVSLLALCSLYIYIYNIERDMYMYI